jgi:hypothetical protein
MPSLPVQQCLRFDFCSLAHTLFPGSAHSIALMQLRFRFACRGQLTTGLAQLGVRRLWAHIENALESQQFKGTKVTS